MEANTIRHVASEPGDNLFVISVDDACVRLHLGRTKVYELIESGELRTRRVGRRRLITMKAIEDFLNDDSGVGKGARRDG